MTAVSIMTRYANGSILVNIPHLTRIRIVTFLQFLSYIGIAIASYYSNLNFMFYVALFASVLTGICIGMGEATFWDSWMDFQAIQLDLLAVALVSLVYSEQWLY